MGPSARCWRPASPLHRAWNQRASTRAMKAARVSRGRRFSDVHARSQICGMARRWAARSVAADPATRPSRAWRGRFSRGVLGRGLRDGGGAGDILGVGGGTCGRGIAGAGRRECRRSGEPVDPVVVRIARVAPDPHEGHVSPFVPYQTEQPLPEVSVLDRAAVRSLPGAIAQPPLVPVLVEALLDVGAVSADFDGTSQRLERLADRGELHAVAASCHPRRQKSHGRPPPARSVRPNRHAPASPSRCSCHRSRRQSSLPTRSSPLS